MPPSRREWFRDGLLTWANDNLRVFPWREPDRTLYEVFVVEFFLTQTPAENVDTVYPQFLAKYPTMEALAEADRDELEETIEPLGFQRMRAEALTEIADTVSAIPADVEELQALPRVGPYVANATLCFALEQSRPVLDRNVVRVYERVFGEEFPDTESDQLAFAEEVLPDDGSVARRYNLALLDFGSLVCTKRSPRCEECFAKDYCAYYQGAEAQPDEA